MRGEMTQMVDNVTAGSLLRHLAPEPHPLAAPTNATGELLHLIHLIYLIHPCRLGHLNRR
jgi:hypothetical protein